MSCYCSFSWSHSRSELLVLIISYDFRIFSAKKLSLKPKLKMLKLTIIVTQISNHGSKITYLKIFKIEIKANVKSQSIFDSFLNELSDHRLIQSNSLNPDFATLIFIKNLIKQNLFNTLFLNPDFVTLSVMY